VSTSIRSEIILGSKVLTELGMEVATVHQPAADSPPPKPRAAPAGELHDQSPWEAWCARQRREQSTYGWPVTDEEGRWLPNKEWPKTPTSGYWGRPSRRSRLFYNGQAVRPEVWDRGGYYDPFVPQRKSVGWSQDLEEVQFIPQRRDDPHQHSEEIEILDGNDNTVPNKAADNMVTTDDNANVTTPNRQRTLPQGYVYTERDNPEITEAQFRENNKEIAGEDQKVVFFSDDDSSVRLTSSGPLSDSDGHGNCGRGGVCLDNLDVACCSLEKTQRSNLRIFLCSAATKRMTRKGTPTWNQTTRT
jgi:hypothetical protein